MDYQKEKSITLTDMIYFHSRVTNRSIYAHKTGPKVYKRYAIFWIPDLVLLYNFISFKKG